MELNLLGSWVVRLVGNVAEAEAGAGGFLLEEEVVVDEGLGGW